MKRLIVESPYAGSVHRNTLFARNVCRYFTLLNYAPFASHLFCTQFLDDLEKDERMLGIEAGFAWAEGVEEVVFALPPGGRLSNGMMLGLNKHKTDGRHCRFMFFDHDGNVLLQEVPEEALKGLL